MGGKLDSKKRLKVDQISLCFPRLGSKKRNVGGGYSPYQLVFGVNPCVPLELLSADQMVVNAFQADGPAQSSRGPTPLGRELESCAYLKDKVRLRQA